MKRFISPRIASERAYIGITVLLHLEDGRYPTVTQTLVVHPNGKLYSVPWIEKLRKGRSPEDRVGHQVDLIGFDNPLGRPGGPKSEVT